MSLFSGRARKPKAKRPALWRVERWLSATPDALPHKFTRRGAHRIITWPTAYGWLLVGLLLVAMLTSLNYNNSSAIGMALFMLMMYLSGLILSQRPLLVLDVLSAMAPDAPAGQAARVWVTVRNTKRHDSLFQLRAIGPTAPQYLAAHALARLSVPIEGLQRGCHPLPRLAFVSMWPFGFCRSTGYVWPKGNIWITPALLEGGLALPSGQAPQVASGIAAQGEHVHHLRPYQPGDAMRDIAWKASARTENLLTRVYEQPRKGHCHIVWSAWSHLPLEQRLSQMATWITQAETEGWTSLLDTPRGRVGPSSGPAHVQEALRLLAGWPATAEEGA